MMHRLSVLWTAAIAYVALAAGAGLSIMYNVLQTKANRGPLLAWHDIVTAVAMPGLVVLMVELYVNRRWRGLPWYFQLMRVVGLGGIGLVAMRASWTHGHAWLLGHGQTEDVAIMWPLAIDALAIMATALLLAGRRAATTATSGNVDLGHVATDETATVTEMVAIDLATATSGHGDLGHDLDRPLPQRTPPWMAEFEAEMAMADPVATRPDGDLDAWSKGYERAIDVLGQDLATEAERFLAEGTHVPVVPGPATVTRRAAVPDDVRAMLLAWDPAALPVKDLDALLAAHTGRAVRTVRNWRRVVLGGPVSGPPSA